MRREIKHFLSSFVALNLRSRLQKLRLLFAYCKFLILAYDSRAKIALWNDPHIIITPTYDDSRAKIALWNDPQIIITPTYYDSTNKIALWNDPHIIISPTYDDSRAKIALWNDPLIAL